ncbi:MAG TPA: hypothetical protein EYP10_15465, partial [Armatimonadetes bacterium]|nr:hypothetical protein [Armatimonadota bacterium]
MRWFLKMFILIAFMEMCVAQEQVAGPVEIFGMVYERIDPGPPFKEQRRKYEPWQLTPPTDIERACGFIAFSRGEPFNIKPWSKPRASERISELTVQLARGEFESCWFAIHALEALERISIGVKSFGNGKMPSVTIMRAHYWAQRVTWKGRTYYIVPELLLPIDDGYSLYPAKGGTLVRKPFNLRCGECGLIWLLVHAPSDLPAGEYRFSITVHAEGMKMRAIPLKIRILPFQLRKPVKKRWLLYGDVWYWGSLSDDNVFAILRDMAEHGIDGLTEMPFGEVDVSQIANGVVKYDPTPLLRLHRMMRRVGMRGPITIGRYVEREIAKALGIKANLWRGDWDDRLKDALRLVARTVTNELKRYGINWFFYAVDEPSPQNTYALQQYRCWHEGGAKTYVTFYRRGTFEKMGDWMDAPCFSVGLINYKDGAKWARNECRRRGKLFFWYGSGCYLGQEGRMFPNRYLAGFLFLKTDADAQVSWTFMRPHEDPFNDFDGVRANSAEPKDQCIVYPQLERPNDRSSFVKIIPTIQWEALCEGIDDYRYAYTLRNLIAYARDKASSLLAFNTPMLIYAKGGALWALPIRNDGTPIRSVKAVRICAVTGNDAISKIAISGDGRYLAFEIDRTLFVWDVRKRAMKKLAGAGNPTFPLQGHALAFLRYRSKFKSDAWLWDLDANAKRLLRKDVHGLIWRADGVELALMPNPLANKLPIVVGVNGKVKFRPHRKPSAPLRSITLSPDGRFLGSYEGLSSPPEMGKIFDRRTGKVFMLPPGKAFYDWSRDGKRLLFEWAVLARNGSYRGIQLGIW